MTASIYWPVTLPQNVERGFSSSVGMNILRTPMDAGPAKLRRRSIKPEVMSVVFMMTTAQVTILEGFINDTIRGVARFNFTHPRKQVEYETRIVPGQDGQFFTATYRAPGYWGVSMQLEILL